MSALLLFRLIGLVVLGVSLLFGWVAWQSGRLKAPRGGAWRYVLLGYLLAASLGACGLYLLFRTPADG